MASHSCGDWILWASKRVASGGLDGRNRVVTDMVPDSLKGTVTCQSAALQPSAVGDRGPPDPEFQPVAAPSRDPDGRGVGSDESAAERSRELGRRQSIVKWAFLLQGCPCGPIYCLSLSVCV